MLNVENAYVAQARIQHLRKYLPVSQNHLEGGVPDTMRWKKALEYSNVLNLSNDLEQAMQMMTRMDEILSRLPGLDCGSCGAPSCRAMAEDVVKGLAKETDCIFILREQVRNVADTLSLMGGGFIADRKNKKHKGDDQV